MAGNLLVFVDVIMSLSSRQRRLGTKLPVGHCLRLYELSLPLRAMALELLRYRCRSIGEVSVDRFLGHIQQKRSLFMAINVGLAP